jgi:hypothetical protein
LSWASTWGAFPSDIFVSYSRSSSLVTGWAAATKARVSTEKSQGIRIFLFIVYFPFFCLGDGPEFGIKGGTIFYDHRDETSRVLTRSPAANLFFFFGLRRELVVLDQKLQVPAGILHIHRLALSRLGIIDPEVVVLDQELVAEFPPGADHKAGII